MTSGGYVGPAVEVDPQALIDRALQSFSARFPSASLPDGSMLRWDIETDALTAADLGTLMLEVAEAITTMVLGRLLNEPQRQPVPATSTVTFTVSGATAAFIPAGTPLAATGPDGEPVSLETLESGAAPQGTTSIVGVPVQVADESAGSAGNLVTGPVAGSENFPFGVSAVLDAPTSGGLDGEDEQLYLGRLVRLSRLVAPRPILPADFAEYVVLKVPGIGAAVALDNTRPGPPVETNVPRAVTVGIRGLDGNQPSGADRSAALAALIAARESTFQPHVVFADYTAVDVSATVYAWPGYDKVAAKAECEDLIRAYLSPATWGAPPARGDIAAGEQPRWEQQTKVRVSEIIAQLDRSNAVDYTDRAAVLIEGANADFTLPGLFPLPTPGTITVTVLDR